MTNALWADVHALLLQLHRAGGGEEIRDVIPHLAIGIETVCALQIQDHGRIVQVLHTRFECCERRCALREIRGGNRSRRRRHIRRDRCAYAIRRVVIGDELRLLALVVDDVVPARFVGPRVLREVLLLADLPHAALERVFVFVNAAGPARRLAVHTAHRNDVPPALRTLAIRIQRDHRREKEDGVQTAIGPQ